MKILKNKFKKIDQQIIPVMQRVGHRTERYLLALIFIWFGILKITGEQSATSIIAKTIYWFNVNQGVMLLGAWELAIGLCFAFKGTLRIAIFLLIVRVPGVLLAFIFHFDDCFTDNILIPNIQGQYLLKELTLVGAALVIGSTINIKKTKSEN